MDQQNIRDRIKTSQINNALGVFMMAFGLVVLFAMFFTETLVQHLTDMVAGLLLMSIGGGMIWKARRTIKKLKTKLD